MPEKDVPLVLVISGVDDQLMAMSTPASPTAFLEAKRPYTLSLFAGRRVLIAKRRSGLNDPDGTTTGQTFFVPTISYSPWTIKFRDDRQVLPALNPKDRTRFGHHRLVAMTTFWAEAAHSFGDSGSLLLSISAGLTYPRGQKGIIAATLPIALHVV